MLQIECTFWMTKNTQSKATQRTNDTRIKLQLIQRQTFFRTAWGSLWQFEVASLMMELLQQWEKLCAINLKNAYFSFPT